MSRSRDVVDVRPATLRNVVARIRVSEDTIIADLGGVTTATLHVSGSYDAGAAGERLAVDSLAMLALAFEHVGQSDLAARLAATFLGESSVITTPEVAFALSSAMARARRVTDALRLSEQLDQREDIDARDESVLFTLPALFHGGMLARHELELFRETLRDRIRRLDQGEHARAARECVNLANHFRRYAEPRAAVRLYAMAARLDPEYRRREHYWRELGGVLFGSHHYVFAAEAYRRALDLGADHFVRSLRADALMRAGQYTEALSLFIEFNRLGIVEAGEWRLKEMLLNVLVDGLGLGKQTRRPEEANELAGRAAKATTPEEADGGLSVARNADALSGLVWFNLGRVLLGHRPRERRRDNQNHDLDLHNRDATTAAPSTSRFSASADDPAAPAEPAHRAIAPAGSARARCSRDPDADSRRPEAARQSNDQRQPARRRPPPRQTRQVVKRDWACDRALARLPRRNLSNHRSQDHTPAPTSSHRHASPFRGPSHQGAEDRLEFLSLVAESKPLAKSQQLLLPQLCSAWTVCVLNLQAHHPEIAGSNLRTATAVCAADLGGPKLCPSLAHLT